MLAVIFEPRTPTPSALTIACAAILRRTRDVSHASREMEVDMHKWMMRMALLSANLAVGISPALASQGPGIADGTAPPALQLATALAVYGGSALVIVAGLIGAVRRR